VPMLPVSHVPIFMVSMRTALSVPAYNVAIATSLFGPGGREGYSPRRHQTVRFQMARLSGISADIRMMPVTQPPVYLAEM
jgi:hypothetical protein